MPTTDDIRKTLTNPNPLYFAAGTADLAAEKLRELPATLDRLRAEAPQRLQTVRETELPKLREQAEALARQGAGFAQECAAKARETYDGLTARGRNAVDSWREQRDPDRTPEPEPAPTVTVERVTQPDSAAGAAAPHPEQASPQA